MLFVHCTNQNQVAEIVRIYQLVFNEALTLEEENWLIIKQLREIIMLEFS